LTTQAHRDPTSPVIVVLAAGEGRRFGGIKQLADIAGEPMVRRVSRIALQSRLPVMVVIGAHADEVASALDGLPLDMVRCEAWQLGMGHSIAKGMQELMRRFTQASCAVLCLADQPLLQLSTIQALLDRHAQAPDRLIATTSQGFQGPPVLFPRDCFDALAALSGSHGARMLLEREAERVEVIACDNFFDVDTKEDLERARQQLASQHQTKPETPALTRDQH
jgi:molybdenum cofactor cytidylyltransferase